MGAGWGERGVQKGRRAEGQACDGRLQSLVVRVREAWRDVREHGADTRACNEIRHGTRAICVCGGGRGSGGIGGGGGASRVMDGESWLALGAVCRERRSSRDDAVRRRTRDAGSYHRM